MVEVRPVTDQLKKQTSTIDNPLWSRLRESMERLRAVDQQTTADALARKLAGRARLLRGSLAVAEPRQAPLVFLALNKGRERYGISVNDVLEVQALEHFTVVPKTPLFLSGVVQWRGAVLTLLDLGRLFGIPESGLADVHVHVVVEAADRRVGIVAHEIEDVYSVPRGSIATAPPLAANVPPEWIVGVHENERLLLNMESILQDPRLADWVKNPSRPLLSEK
jgi:purine-binding chemotaxis protein CheW